MQTTDRTPKAVKTRHEDLFLPKCQTALANTSGKNISKCVLAVFLRAMPWGEGGLSDQSHDLCAFVGCPHCRAALGNINSWHPCGRL